MMLRLIRVGSAHPTDYKDPGESCQTQVISPGGCTGPFTFCINLALIAFLGARSISVK